MRVRYAPMLILVGLCAIASVQAATYFVSPDGDDASADATNSATPFKTINHAIAVASSGDNIRLLPGSTGIIIENVIVTKSLDIASNSTAARVTVIPGTAEPAPVLDGSTGSLPAGHSTVFLIRSSDVTIHDLTIDGTNSALAGKTVGTTTYVARNGIITDTNLSTVFTNLTVQNVTVQNIYLRGIQNGTGGFTHVKGCTVTNVNGDSNRSISIFNRTGTALIENNIVSQTSDAISANFSLGTTFQNNTITNSGSGVHTDNCSAADVIQGNTISNSTAGGYGIFVFYPYKNAVVQNNTITNVTIGLATFGGVATAGVQGTPAFTNNTVNGQQKANSIGAYLTTNVTQLGFPDIDCAATFNNNTITGNVTGLRLEQTSGFTLTATVANNIFSGNSSDGIDAFGLTNPLTISSCDLSGNGIAGINNFSPVTITATNNWWGSASGPRNSANTFNLPAQGSAAGAHVTFVPWLNSGGNSAAVGFVPTGSPFAPVTTSSPAGSYASIQAGVTASNAAGTVTAAAGSYSEGVAITKSLTLTGAGANTTTISAAAGLTAGPGGESAIVSIRGAPTTNATVSGFTLDGFGAAQNGNGFFGVFVRDGAAGNIHDNIIQNLSPAGASATGVGIAIGRKALSTTGTATVTNNTIRDYEKAGIVVDNINSTATISGNTVIGAGPTTAIASNGIQISRGATGSITGNTVMNNFYSGSDGQRDPASDVLADGASGILLYAAGVIPSDTITVSGNTLIGNQYAVWSVGSTALNIHDNALQGDGTKGVIGSSPFDGGILVWDSDQYTTVLGFTAVGTVATVLNNASEDFDYALQVRNYTTGAPAMTVTATKNDFSGFGSTAGLFSNVAIDARQNWWGNATGPKHATNAPGTGTTLGESTAGLVQFSPWLGDGTDTQAAVGFQPNATPLYGRPQKLTFTVQPVGAASGATLATQPSVTVTDNAGFANPFTTATVALSLASGPSSATLSGTTSVTLTNGTAAFTNLAVNTSGTYTFSAASTGLTSATSAAFTITIPSPSLVSAPIATPNPAVVGTIVTFTASGSDATGRPLTTTWNFGDGTSGTGSTVTHAYTAPNTFVATVTLTSPEGSSVSGTANVVITAGAAPPAPQPFSVTKKSLRAKVPSLNKDTIQITGAFALPTGTTSLIGPVTLNIGSLNQTFNLDKRGSGKVGPQNFRIKAKFKKNVLQSLNVTFQAKLVGNVTAALSAAGLPTGTSGTATLAAQFTYLNTTYATNVTVAVKATKSGATGK